jgi:hypothetical protein
MSLSPDARREIVEKFTSSADQAVDPAVVEQIIDDVVTASEEEAPASRKASASRVPTPFAAPWLDSFLAHWALGENVDLTPHIAETDGRGRQRAPRSGRHQVPGTFGRAATRYSRCSTPAGNLSSSVQTEQSTSWSRTTTC